MITLFERWKIFTDQNVCIKIILGIILITLQGYK